MKIIADVLSFWLMVFSCVSVLCSAASCDSESPYADNKKKNLLEGTTTLKACLSCPVMEG